MSKRSRGATVEKPVAPAADLTTQRRGNVELFVECVDEDLAPSQKEAPHKANTEYQRAVEYQRAMERVELAHRSSSQAVTTPTMSLGRARTSINPIAITDDAGMVVVVVVAVVVQL